MTKSIIPQHSQRLVDDNGLLTRQWMGWVQTVSRAAGINNDADIAAIARVLGSPDGTVDSIPPQTENNALILGLNGILTDGTLSSGRVTVSLSELEDTGVGAALMKFTRDVYGRIEGMQAATTDDLTEGATNFYATNERIDDRVAALLTAGSGITLTYNDPANTLTIASGGGGGGMSLVGTVTVAGAAATAMTLSGLNLATDGAYLIHAVVSNATASVFTLSLFFNGDTTATNYWEQVISADATSNNAARANDGLVGTIEASASSFIELNTRSDFNGNPRTFSRCTRGTATLPKLQLFSHVRNNTANVTSITLSSSVASALAVGSYFKVWKVN